MTTVMCSQVQLSEPNEKLDDKKWDFVDFSRNCHKTFLMKIVLAVVELLVYRRGNTVTL
jgi:hypothetical protein